MFAFSQVRIRPTAERLTRERERVGGDAKSKRGSGDGFSAGRDHGDGGHGLRSRRRAGRRASVK